MLQRYAWSEGAGFDALNLTWVAYTGPVEDVLASAGGGWEYAPRTSYDGALDLVDGFDFDREPLLFEHVDGWWLLAAPNGYELSLPEVAAEVSRLGRVVSVFWNVNASMQFLVAEAGDVERRFDPLLYADVDGEPLPEESALPFGDAQAPLHAAALTLAEQLTGVGVPDGWLLREHDAAIIRRQSSQR